MYVLVSRVGYVTDVDDRGYVTSSRKLINAVKYLSLESAEEDAVLSKCKIRNISECEPIFNPNMKKLDSFKDELEKLLMKYNAEFRIKESYTDSPKVYVVNKNNEVVDLEEVIYQSFIK